MYVCIFLNNTKEALQKESSKIYLRCSYDTDKVSIGDVQDTHMKAYNTWRIIARQNMSKYV